MSQISPECPRLHFRDQPLHFNFFIFSFAGHPAGAKLENEKIKNRDHDNLNTYKRHIFLSFTVYSCYVIIIFLPSFVWIEFVFSFPRWTTKDEEEEIEEQSVKKARRMQ